MTKLIKCLFNVDTDEFSKIIKDIIIITIFTVFTGFIINIFLPKGFIFVNTSIQKSKNIVLISCDEAIIKMNSGSVLFVDSRQSSEYETIKISGAINIPATPASIAAKKIQENFDLISKPVELIIYCDGDTCGSSKILADRLIDMGYSRHIYIISDGIDKWINKGYPVIKKSAESVDRGTGEK
jgi:rhodanese-related sulfurtransferase